MSTLIVGGDRVNTYIEYLENQGLGPVRHWDGRRNSDCHRVIPRGTRLVVILVDQVNHRLAIKMRLVAGERELPVIFSRRSTRQLGRAITRIRDNSSLTSSWR